MKNIIILGVGHSGTTVLTQAIERLGWKSNAGADKFSECVTVRSYNDAYMAGMSFGRDELQGAIDDLECPWVLKDPRFIFTLGLWDFVDALLVWVRRSLNAVEESYVSRGELLCDKRGGMYGRSVEEMHELAMKRFEEWSGEKVALDLENIKTAAALFRL